MKALLALSLILTSNIWADDEVCSKKEITINARYGKHSSPLLDTWSETSGNLTKLEINSKEKFSKAELVFQNDQKETLKTVPLNLKNNQTNTFNFMNLFNDLKVFPHHLRINIKRSNDKSVCSELVTLIQKDVSGGVLKKP